MVGFLLVWRSGRLWWCESCGEARLACGPGTSWKVPGYSLEVLGAGAGVALAGAAFLGRDFLAASARWRSWWRRSWNGWSEACFFIPSSCHRSTEYAAGASPAHSIFPGE